MWADVHCHLSQYPRPVETIRNAEDKGVGLIVTSSETLADTINNQNLARNYKSVFYCAGQHPHHVTEESRYEMKGLIEKIDKHDKKLVGVGEIGLDFNHVDEGQRFLQQDVSRHFLEVAVKERLPIVIHSRDAAEYTFKILEDYKLKRVLLHYFMGNTPELIQEAIDRKYYLSIDPRILTSKRIRENAKMPKVHRVLLE
ncbi:MAG: hypothetical protein GOV15_00715, partial [Candidatus Diapherotrites archaeon]|nr:hypothetical protein [Candidatus Diapherotrites archaeon]